MKVDDWSSVLDDHPIFSLPKSINGAAGYPETSLELSTNTLPSFITVDPREDTPTPSGRRQVMILKNEDLIVAAGQELRITSLGDFKMGRSPKKSYKVTSATAPCCPCSYSVWTGSAFTKRTVRDPSIGAQPEW
jgi:nucleoporin NUP82